MNMIILIKITGRSVIFIVKQYSKLSYIALLFGLTSLLFLLPLAISKGVTITLVVISVIGLLLSVIGLFKKNEKKLILCVSFIASLWLPSFMLYMSWIMV